MHDGEKLVKKVGAELAQLRKGTIRQKIKKPFVPVDNSHF
jgi:hypothetical protein